MAETSKTVDHALSILLEVAQNGPRSPAEVARALGLNRTVVHRLLATLHRRGFVAREEAGYVPGAMLVRLAAHVQPRLRAQGREVMRRLCEETGETVVMHVPDGGDAVVLDQVVAERNVVRVEHEIGSRHPLGAGASGRAILAGLSPVAIARVAGASSDPEGLERRLAGVRRLGYSLSHDELQQGVHGLAVPVLDAGDAVASLAILVPVSRAGAITEHTDALRHASARLSELVGG